MAIFSADEIAAFERDGYVVLREAVAPAECAAVVDAIFSFLGMDPDDPSDWYREPHRTSGFVELYHHPSLWANRQNPRIHEGFSQLLGTDELWVSIDRAGFKPPPHVDHPDYDHKGFVHWDADTSTWPLPFSLQAVLYLTDTAKDQGGYQCVPGMHRAFDEWVKTQPADRDPRNPDLQGLEVHQVEGKQGDLIIWTRALAHGNGHNTSDTPRFAQYITLSPAEDDEEERQRRIELFEQRRPPARTAFPGDPRGWEQEQPMAELTPLGRRLLGLDRW